MTNLERFQNYTKDYASPNLFIKFNFYFAIGSALARKVWLGDDKHYIFPNLYLIFVGDPALGKSMPAFAVYDLLDELKTIEDGKVENLINLGPTTITFEKLLIRAQKPKSIKISDKEHYTHCSSCFILDEMATMFRENTQDIVTFLVTAFDCKKFERDNIGRGVLWIPNICVNFLGCSTQEKIGRLMRGGLLEDGFTGRVIFLFANENRDHPARIMISESQVKLREELKEHLKTLATLFPGEVKYTPDAIKWFDSWYDSHKRISTKRINANKKLKDYYARKRIHLQKVAMCCHFADKTTMILEVEDFEAALKLLESAEPCMHEGMAAGGRNPLHELSVEIIKDLRQKKELSIKMLVATHFNNASALDIQEVITHLEQTEQVKRVTLDNGKEGVRYMEPKLVFDI